MTQTETAVTATSTPGSVTPLITVAQVPAELKEKLIDYFNEKGLTIRSVRVAAAGVSTEGFKLANPNREINTLPQALVNAKELTNFYKQDAKHYATVALQVYTEGFINDAVEEAYPELTEGSVPDATGNDIEGEACPFCNEVH